MKLPYQQGRYCLHAEMARGGMATVYRGTVEGIEGFSKPVAIKRILPQWSSDREFVAMLIDEAKVLMQLHHPNVVEVYELGMHEGVYFLAMEYLAGMSLAELGEQLHHTRDRIPAALAYAIVLEVLKGLAYVHTRLDPSGTPLGLVHRDISPENIFCTFHGAVKVIDFGIAKGAHRAHLSVGPHLKGKYAYMAPEQARGEPVDARADIYAVGAVFFELLTGRRLYTARNDVTLLERVRRGDRGAHWLREIPPVVQPILVQALSVEPTDRFSSVTKFLAELNHMASTHDEVASTIGLSQYLHEHFPARVAAEQHAADRTTRPMAGKIVSDVAPRFRVVALLMLMTGVLGFSLADIRDVRIGSRAMAVRQIPVPPPAAPLRPPHIAQGQLRIHARPWGLVSIPGLVSQQETPVEITLDVGEYEVHIQQRAGDAMLSSRALIKPLQRTDCVARLSTARHLRCVTNHSQ